MDETSLFGYILGPLGGFALALGLLYGLVRRRYVAPIWTLEKEEQRAGLLEEENKTLNQVVIELKISNGTLTYQIKMLNEGQQRSKEELKNVRRDLARLRKEVNEK